MRVLASHLPSWHWSSASTLDEKKKQSEENLDVLPVASPVTAAFAHDPQPRHWNLPMSLLLVLSLFPLSTAAVYLSIRTLPIAVTWPRTIADITQLAREFHGYASSGPRQCLHVLYVMSITSIWKHAWSIPGSVIWNILAGTLFNPILATLLLTVLTTVGSICSSLLAKPLSPMIHHLFPKMLDMTRAALEGASSTIGQPETDKPTTPLEPQSRPWVRLSVLRLIGVVPWSGINLASGICGIPLFDIAIGAFIGVLPWNAVTCQVGSIVRSFLSSPPNPTTSASQTISSLVFSPEIILKLIFLTTLSLLPILGRQWLKDLIASEPAPTIEKPRGPWTLSSIMRRVSHSPSPSDDRRRARELELEEIVREKREVEVS